MKEKSKPNKVVLGQQEISIYFSCWHECIIRYFISDVKLDFEGDFNPMMAMMIKGPIGKFEALATNMKLNYKPKKN
jgi:hypothetical protein